MTAESHHPAPKHLPWDWGWRKGCWPTGWLLWPFPTDPTPRRPAPFSHTLVIFIYSYIYYSYILKRGGKKKNLPEEKLLKDPSGSGSLLSPHPQKFSYIKSSSAIFRKPPRAQLPPPPALGLPPSSSPAPGGIQSHLWPSIAAMAFCCVLACCAPGGHVGCGWWRWWKLWAVGEEGGIQAAWWLGGDEAQKGLKFAGGEQATAVMGLLLLCRPSEARSFENMASASGKLGGVAGVLLGVHICWERTQGSRGLPTWALLPDPQATIRGPTELAFPWGSPRPDPLLFPIVQSKRGFSSTKTPCTEPLKTKTMGMDSYNFCQNQSVSFLKKYLFGCAGS